MQRILLAGVSHHLLNPVELPRCIESRDRALAILKELKTRGDLLGALLLATCNRVEVLAEAAPGFTVDALAAGIFAAPVSAPPYLLAGESAVRHLIRVASSLDSMVVGEDQILAQVKEAFEDCRAAGLMSPRLDLLVRESLRSAKEIRTRTGIAHRPVSVASVAADALREGGGLARGARVAVLGAGEMARRVAEALVARASARILVVNRSEERAVRLARKSGGEWTVLEAFLADPPRVDAIVGAATCAVPLLTTDRVRVLLERAGGRLSIMDLACPPNIDPASAALAGVRLLGLEDLRSHASRNLSERKDEAREAERLVARAVRRAGDSLIERGLDLGSVRDLHEELADEEVREALATRLAHLSAADQGTLVDLGRKLARRHAHLHLSSLRDRLQAELP